MCISWKQLAHPFFLNRKGEDREREREIKREEEEKEKEGEKVGKERGNSC